MNTEEKSQSSHSFRIVAAAGGTGGHIYPAVAVVEALRDITSDNVEAEFLGSEDRMETTIIPQLGYRLTSMPIHGFKGLTSASTLKLPFEIIKSVRIARALIRKVKPHVVICTGAYISFPAGRAAVAENVPLILLESNLNLGKSNARLAASATRIVLAFEESVALLPEKLRSKAVVLGNPVRANITGATSKHDALRSFGLHTDKQTVLVFGGSLGARSINNATQRLVDTLAGQQSQNIQLIWQTGKGFAPTIPDALRSVVKAMPYINDMEGAFSAADLVVSRSGATTIAELGIVGKPAVLVPLPTASTDEQRRNARVLEQAGAGIVVEDSEIETELSKMIGPLLANTAQLHTMSEAMRTFGRPHAAREVARMLLDISQQRHLEEVHD